jgi:hypothetical protein
MYYKKTIFTTILFISATIVSFSCGGDDGEINGSQNTIVQNQATESNPTTWGKIISDQPQVFATSDIDQSLIDLNNQWYNIAVNAWGNYGPVELYIIGTNEQAAKTLEDDFCDRHKKLDSRWRVEWDCANDRYKIFTNYVEEGGAAVSVYRRDYIDYHFMTLIMSSKYPFPDEEDYKKTVLHEYFHVYQHAHIEDIEIENDRSVRGAKQGGERNPWFAEGSAEYMAQLLCLRQLNVNPNYVKDSMRRNYYSIDEYLSSGKNLKELSYSDQISAADVGTWFIAYLVHQFGEETVRVDFYQDLNSLGFDGSFKKHFNKSSDDLIDEFDLFIAGGVEKALEIIP